MATSLTFHAIRQAPRIVTDPQIRSLYLKASYVLYRNDILLLLASRQANAAECGSMANRVGFGGPNGAIGVGRNGAASYNKNAGAVHTSPAQNSNQVAPGANIQGWRGHSATKAGCARIRFRQRQAGVQIISTDRAAQSATRRQ
jgi:hypothetical protein